LTIYLPFWWIKMINNILSLPVRIDKLTRPLNMCRGATTAEKLRGPRFGSQHQGACAPSRQRPGWMLGAEGGHFLPLWGSGGITPGKFFKTQMLNPAFWWLTCCEISCFLKITAKKLRDQYIVGPPNIEVGGPVSLGPYSCCAYKFVQKFLHTARTTILTL